MKNWDYKRKWWQHCSPCVCDHTLCHHHVISIKRGSQIFGVKTLAGLMYIKCACERREEFIIERTLCLKCYQGGFIVINHRINNSFSFLAGHWIKAHGIKGSRQRRSLRLFKSLATVTNHSVRACFEVVVWITHWYNGIIVCNNPRYITLSVACCFLQLPATRRRSVKWEEL